MYRLGLCQLLKSSTPVESRHYCGFWTESGTCSSLNLHTFCRRHFCGSFHASWLQHNCLSVFSFRCSVNTKIFLCPGHPSAASAPPATGGGASEAPSDSRQPAGKEPLPQWAGGLLQRLHHFLSGQLDRQQVHTHTNTEAGHYYVAQEAFLLVPGGSQIQKAEFLQNFGLKEGFSFGKKRHTVSKLGAIMSWSLC